MTIPEDNTTTSDPAAQVGKAERFDRGARKARNVALAIWAYLFYGAVLGMGVLMVAGGIVQGWIFIAAAVVLFVLYWLFGYVICCR